MTAATSNHPALEPCAAGLIYRLRNGITPVDPNAIESRARAAKYRGYDDILIG